MPTIVRLVIAGGGTGGHVQPALAVLHELLQRVEIEPLWIGTRDGVEWEAAKEHNIPFVSIQTGKLRRYFSFQTPIDALRIPLGTAQAFINLRRFRPNVVLSTGGFVSVPTVIAARLLGIPSLTHEQTATVGLATRINARFCDVVALSFEKSRSQLRPSRARLTVTGNPVRPTLFDGNAAKGRQQFGLGEDLPLVYVTGGALGAHAINLTIADALPRLLEVANVVHQCGLASGNGDAPRLQTAKSRLPKDLRNRYVIRERIGSELADLYAAASLVIGRAGAGTVAELAALGKPSILIPLPGAGGDEQTVNARVLADDGAAVILPQEQLNPDRLLAEIEAVLSNGRLERMASAARLHGNNDAGAMLADEILRLATLPAGRAVQNE